MSRRQMILDCETTSLNPDYEDGTGVIWELACIERDTGTEHLWRMEPEPDKADPGALTVGKYYKRTARMKHVDHRVHDLAGRNLDRSAPWTQPKSLAPVLARLLDDVTLIIAVPTFDDPYLKAFLRAYGQAPTWHHRARDIGSMAYGYLRACLALGVEGRDAALGVPDTDAGTDDFARALGVDPDQFERHSALGDCRLVGAMLDVIEGAQ